MAVPFLARLVDDFVAEDVCGERRNCVRFLCSWLKGIGQGKNDKRKDHTMIIRHQGRSLIEDEFIIGYAVYEGYEIYIYQKDGSKTQVKEGSVSPILSDLNRKAEPSHVREGVHPLCCLDLSDILIADLKCRGAMCLEDLETWTDEDFKELRGLGPVKIKKIRDTLRNYGIGSQERLDQ